MSGYARASELANAMLRALKEFSVDLTSSAILWVETGTSLEHIIPSTSIAARLDFSSIPPTTLGMVCTLRPGLSNQSRLGATATRKSLGTRLPDLRMVETRTSSHFPGERVDRKSVV